MDTSNTLFISAIPVRLQDKFKILSVCVFLLLSAFRIFLPVVVTGSRNASAFAQFAYCQQVFFLKKRIVNELKNACWISHNHISRPFRFAACVAFFINSTSCLRYANSFIILIIALLGGISAYSSIGRLGISSLRPS